MQHNTNVRSHPILASRSTADNAPSSARGLGRSHSRGFWRWVSSDLGLFRLLRQVRDGRDLARTSIPLDVLLVALLAMYWFQLPSLNALDDHLRHGGWLRRQLRVLGYADGIADDTFRNALAKLELDSVRRVLVQLNRRMLKGWGAGRYLDSQLGRLLAPIAHQRLAAKAVVAIDGHYLFGTTSAARCCADCQRKPAWRKGERVTEYYHSLVVAQMMGAHPALVLDCEPVRYGENELTAVKRLLPRLAEAYGERIGIIVADALYDTEPFRRQVFELGYRSVVVHKTDNHDPARTAERNLAARDPDRLRPDVTYRPGPRTCYRVWEEPAGRRRLVEVRRSGPRGTWKSQAMTDLPPEHAHPVAVGILLEERWDVENTGFKQLVCDWNLDRAYVHTNKPSAVWACAMLALLAYNVFHIFVYRVLGLDPHAPQRPLQALRRDLLHSAGDLATRGPPRARAP